MKQTVFIVFVRNKDCIIWARLKAFEDMESAVEFVERKEKELNNPNLAFRILKKVFVSEVEEVFNTENYITGASKRRAYSEIKSKHKGD